MTNATLKATKRKRGGGELFASLEESGEIQEMGRQPMAARGAAATSSSAEEMSEAPRGRDYSNDFESAATSDLCASAWEAGARARRHACTLISTSVHVVCAGGR